MRARLPDLRLPTPALVAIGVAILLLLVLAALALRGGGDGDGTDLTGATATDGATTPDDGSATPAAQPSTPAASDLAEEGGGDDVVGGTGTAGEPAGEDAPGAPTLPAAPGEAADGAGELLGTGADGVPLPAGTCIEVSSRAVSVGEAEVVDCDQPHPGEVYVATTVDLPADAPYPDAAALQAEVTTLCRGPAFEAYFGQPYDQSRFFDAYLIPTADTWAAGDRDVVCFIYDVAGLLEGSQRDGGS